MSVQTKVDSFFKKEFNKKPSLFIAPGRINMIGEHTDYNDGFVMPTAIDKHFVFAIAPNGSDVFTIHALDLNEKISFTKNELRPGHSWQNYLMGVVDGLIRRGKIPGGVNCVFSSDIPGGAGLSSSAALCSGFGFALNKLFDLGLDPLELAKYVLYQMGALAGIAKAAGAHLTHMSFHGALGNMAAASYELAEPLVRAVADFDNRIIVSVSTNTQIERAADKIGLRVANTFLADRAYDNEGNLVSRKLEGAVIKDRVAVLARVTQLLEDGTVTTITGQRLKIAAQSILLHGDTPGAVELARTVRGAIESAGGRIVPVSRLIK